EMPRPIMIRESVFAEKLRIILLLSPVARMARPTSVCKNQSARNLIMNVTKIIKKRIPHVEGKNFTPNEVSKLFIAWSIPNEPQNSLNLVNKVCSFIKGILGLPTEFSVVSPMILRLIEY